MTKAFEAHNHKSCVSGTLAQVKKTCAQNGLRLTPVRRRVLEILLEEHKAIGAYDILERLSAENMGSGPPVAYRALDFLVAHGFAHKLQKLNAFIACGHPDDVHTPIFMICNGCDAVAEADIGEGLIAINSAASALGFKIKKPVIEADGTCPQCQDAASE